MRSSKPGCLTLSGLAATVITIMIIIVIGIWRGNILFSPGPLNAVIGVQALGGVWSHAETGGNCGTCHSAPWSSDHMADRCLTCHAHLKSSNQNFHQVMISQGMTTGCFTCHTEHQGAEAPLTRLALQDFPHDQVGFSLAAHQTRADGSPFTCADCHASNFQAVLSSDCVLCHNQIDASFINIHLNDFGENCLGCHDGVDRFTHFNHQLTAFQLTGKHVEVSCSDCHSGAANLQAFQDTAQACIACHSADDAHQGHLGTDCAACHIPDGWNNAAFDHTLAGFPLEGKHAQVACSDCHPQSETGQVFKGTPQACSACHSQDDPHGGKFGNDCSPCHTPQGWKPAAFDHSQTNFQLTGAHLQVACDQCHVNQVFAGTPQACSVCHSEPEFHLGLFESSCNDCHTTDGWSPAGFNQTHIFPINHGNRSGNSCRTCHDPSLTTYTCYGCHEHTLQNTAAKHSEEGIRDLSNCARCHPTGSGEGGEGGGDD